MTAKLGGMAKSGGQLAIVTLFCVSLLVLVNGLTRARIQEQQRLAQLRSLQEVLPARYYDNDILTDTMEVVDPLLLGTTAPQTIFRGYLNGEASAAVMQTVAPNGYNGPIQLLIGIDIGGVVTGVRVTRHSETPRLGDEIDAQVSDWVLGFEGRGIGDPALDQWTTKRDGGAFDQFTGATISPRAVVEAVRDALLFFRANQKTIFAPRVTSDTL